MKMALDETIPDKLAEGKSLRMRLGGLETKEIENIASIRVMENAGLKFEKEFWGDYYPHSGSPDVLYKR